MAAAKGAKEAAAAAVDGARDAPSDDGSSVLAWPCFSQSWSPQRESTSDVSTTALSL